MNFIGLSVPCDDEKRELLLAELSLFPFVAFEETNEGLSAYCEEQDWNEGEVKEVLDRYQVTYTAHSIEKVNWNEEWEKNYDPVIVGDQCIVRATFHEARPEIPYEIIITPKMSFGTGHHATTHQVLKYQLTLDHQDKKVLDVGCGTGALAIMAAKRGASEVSAIDIDEWCIENSQENFSLNSCNAIRLALGGIETVPEAASFDVILANINKNVLMEQLPEYQKRLKNAGILVLSGFYTEDIPDLLQRANHCHLSFLAESEMDRWAMLVLVNN